MSKVIDVSGQKVEMIAELNKTNSGAFVYLDPPYYPVGKTKSGKVAPYKLYNGFDWLPVDFIKLKLRCDELTRNGVPFVLSNSDCEFIRILFQDYIIVDINESRGMKSGKGKGSRPGENCLIITNFKEKKEFMGAIDKMNGLAKKKRGKV